MPRMDFLVDPDCADEFEAALAAEVRRIAGSPDARVRRPTVKGQSLEIGAAELVKIVVALGGGVGVAAVVKEIGRFVVEFMKARRTAVRIQDAEGRVVSLENCTPEQVREVLESLSA